jgi:NhaA family Na+:H+ antiporter
MKSTLIKFFKSESAVGVVLIIATLLAMMMANSPLSSAYAELIETPVVVVFGEFKISKPLLLWINDGLMAIFFFVIGLEIKREVIEGSLKNKSEITLPAFAAFGGMFVPALIFVVFNWGNDEAMTGWAIPAATDIAFALGILSLLGRQIPVQLKIFLLTLAIIDDLGAIIIIALFYTADLSVVSLGIAGSMIALLVAINRAGVTNYAVYLLIATVLWIALLKSGVHATLAGVMMGLFLPLKNDREDFHRLEHVWHAPVNFIILPLFAFANAGIVFSDVTVNDFTADLTLGIALGLFVGKQIGVFGMSFLAIKLGLGKLPDRVSWRQLYGVAMLSGIGFTMSLFIGSLAFECTHEICFNIVDYRMGILIGSFLSGLGGYLLLRTTLIKENP